MTTLDDLKDFKHRLQHYGVKKSNPQDYFKIKNDVLINKNYIHKEGEDTDEHHTR